jgi:hypothetical protein
MARMAVAVVARQARSAVLAAQVRNGIPRTVLAVAAVVVA